MGTNVWSIISSGSFMLKRRSPYCLAICFDRYNEWIAFGKTIDNSNLEIRYRKNIDIKDKMEYTWNLFCYSR